MAIFMNFPQQVEQRQQKSRYLPHTHVFQKPPQLSYFIANDRDWTCNPWARTRRNPPQLFGEHGHEGHCGNELSRQSLNILCGLALSLSQRVGQRVLWDKFVRQTKRPFCAATMQPCAPKHGCAQPKCITVHQSTCTGATQRQATAWGAQPPEGPMPSAGVQ